MSAITSPLNDSDRKIVGECLQGALIDLIDLSLLAKQAHWNLVGRNFRSLHLQLDEIVDVARKHTDRVAERAIAIGVNPDGRCGTVARETQLKQLNAGYLQDTQVVEAFTDIGVRTFPGELGNLKVTFARDIAVAERLLSASTR